MLRNLWIFLTLSAAGLAQPYVNYRGVVNVASYMAPGLPAGSLAQGGMVAIFGRNLGPSTGVQASAFPLSTTLSTVSITLTQQSTTVNALPVYVSSGQINAIVPSNAPLGRGTMQVTVNGVVGNPSPVNVVASSFGAFSANGGGFGPGIVQNNSSAGPVINSTQVTAAPQQVETLWGTGLGPVAQDDVAPTVGNLPVKVEVFVGGQPAAIAYSGRTRCCAGIDQINFTVPANAPSGCYVPVVVRLNGSVVSNTVTMAIDPKGAPCTDPANPYSSVLQKGGKFGAALLAHDDSQVSVAGALQEVAADYAAVSLRQEAGGQFAFNPYVSLPPLGTCTAYGAAGFYPFLNDIPGAAPSVKDLDGGASLSITAPAGTVTLPKTGTVPQLYASLLSTSLNLPNVLPSFFTPGVTSNLSGTSGNDIGPFQATVTAGSALSWTNQASIGTVTRSGGLTITWSNAPAGAPFVAIIGYNVDQPDNASGGFECIADASTGSFTVPAVAMGNVPATPANAPANLGFIAVGVPLIGSAASFTATGLDKGVAVYGSIDRQAVSFE